jgi:hypothetical protein
MEEQERVMQLYELAANEHDLQKLRGLILEISILLEAKEQRLKDKTPNAYQD